MKRQGIKLLTLTWLIVGMTGATASRIFAAPPQAILKAVTLADPSAGNELLVQIAGEYSFKVFQATEDTLFIDLQGVKLGDVSPAGRWADGLVTGYRASQYSEAGRPVVRLQIELKHQEPVSAQRDATGLRLRFGQGPSSSNATPGTPNRDPLPTTSTTNTPAPPSPYKGVIDVSDVSIKAGSAGETVVDVSTTHPANYRVLQLKSPARLVVDLEGARNAVRRRSFAGSSPVLKDVRVAQFDPKTVRIVADLQENPVFDVHAYEGGVRIELKQRQSGSAQVSAPGPKTNEPAVSPEASQSARAVTTAPVLQSPVANSQSTTAKPAQSERKPELTADSSQPTPTKKQEAKETPKPEIQNTLPASEGSKEAAATPRPEPLPRTPEAFKAENAARILTAELQANPVTVQAETPGTSQATNPGAGTRAGEEKPQYTGEPISLNLKDVDLKDFFRLIHEISGLNIIVDPNVTGSVTMVLDSVPWDQALDIVLKNNRLGKTLEGNVLRIARLDTLTSEQESAAKLTAAREEAAPLVTLFRPVNYAKASTISTLLKSWAGGGALSKRGNVLVDDRTNTLIISDIQTQIPIIENIISKLDKKAKQVAIEARIVLATSTFIRNLQSALSGSFINKSGSTVGTGITGTGAAVTPQVTLSNPPAPAISVVPTSAAGFGAFAVSNASARYVINAAIAAAENLSQAKTISRPTIVTQNNVQGMVQQGTQIPIQTNINNTIAIQYVNATLQLQVTPQVTDDGNIFMIINVMNASPGPALTQSGPSINTQTATTQVLVPDGGTVVFGGITVTQRTKSLTYVPLLGSIPVIGHLFKTSNTQDTDNELLFFVSPRILS
jgi:type IV pilus assembly protein PilQ